MADGGSSVVVTGLGVVSPIGVGHAAFWETLCAGSSGIRSRGGSTPPRLAARLPDYDAREFIASPHVRRMDKLSRALVSASRMALADADLPSDEVNAERLGIVVGSMLGNISESVQYLSRLFTKGPALASPMLFPNLVLNAPASYAAMEIGCLGANLSVSQGELSGEQALAVGCDLIRSGRADVVLAGGGDEWTDIVSSSYRRFHSLSGQRGGEEWCSPYDAKRNGLVLGEGSAMLVLESPEHARGRGARMYAEISQHVSFGIPAPLYDWPQSATAAVPRVQRLLTSAEQTAPGRAPVDLVCGSANSSRRLDACELDLVARLFGETAARVCLTSIKGAVGEFGAAGALSAVAVCLALHTGTVPPLCNLQHPPPESIVRLAARVGQRQALDHALLIGLARGGAGIALLLCRAGT